MNNIFFLPKILFDNSLDNNEMIESVENHLAYLKKQYVGLVMEKYLLNNTHIDYFIVYTNMIVLKENQYLELDVQTQIKHHAKEDYHFKTYKKEMSLFNQLLELWEEVPHNNYKDIINQEISLDNINSIKTQLASNYEPSIIKPHQSHFYESFELPLSINQINQYDATYLSEIKEKINLLKKQEFILTLEQFFNDNVSYDIPDLMFKFNHYHNVEISFPEELPFARTLDGIELDKALNKIIQENQSIYSMVLPLHGKKINYHNYEEMKQLMLSEKEYAFIEKTKLEISLQSNLTENEYSIRKIKI